MKWNELPEKIREQFIAKGFKRIFLEKADYYQSERGEYMVVT